MVLEVERDTNSDVKILQKFRVNRKKRVNILSTFFMSSCRQDRDLKMNLSISYSIVNSNSLKVLWTNVIGKRQRN
jgi:hypothetical protein